MVLRVEGTVKASRTPIKTITAIYISASSHQGQIGRKRSTVDVVRRLTLYIKQRSTGVCPQV